MNKNYDIIVIGAGIAGIATAKNLVQDGFNICVIEATGHVGGLWQYTPEGYGVTSFTHINVSKHNYCFSDFPFPEGTPDFPGHDDMAKYINAYVDHFGFRDKIQFNTRVTHLSQRGSTWEVTVEKNGESFILQAQGVAIASGHHAQPVEASFPGQETFKGDLYHAVKFKNGELNNLKDKRLLIVGIGNSAIDIASHATQYCPKVTLSTRSGAWVLPNYVFGVPTDFYASRALLSLPWKVNSWILETIVTLITGAPQQYGLNPKYRAFQSQPTISPTLIHYIQRGYVNIKPNVKEFRGNRVIFEDGSSDEYDTVIMSTGYKINLPYLSGEIKSKILDEDNNTIYLYKNVFCPSYGHSLAFIGFVQPFSGGILCMAETQGRWFSQLMKNKVSLPSPQKMEKIIKSDLHKIKSRFTNSNRHTIQQDPILYTDEIASMIGVKPTIWKNPLLAFNLLFGSCGTYQYRLNGPGKWKDAAKYVKKAPPTGLAKVGALSFLFIVVIPLLVILSRISKHFQLFQRIQNLLTR